MPTIPTIPPIPTISTIPTILPIPTISTIPTIPPVTPPVTPPPAKPPVSPSPSPSPTVKSPATTIPTTGGISKYGGDLIFKYSNPIAFIGGLLYALIASFGFDLSTMISNKTASVILNVIIGLSSIISLSYWFGEDFPFVSEIINSSITKYGVHTPPLLNNK